MRIFECKPTMKAGREDGLATLNRRNDFFTTFRMTRLLVVAILIVISGLTSCRSPDISKTTFIRDTTYTIIPPVIIDSGRAEIQLRITNDELREETPKSPKGTLRELDSCFIPASQDTVYQYAKIRAGDTVIKFEFVPRTRWVYYKIKPDTIFYTARDTLTKYETKEKIIETPWMAKVGIFCYGIVAAIILAMIIYAINWYKYGRVKPITDDELRITETPKSPKGTLREAKSDDGLP